MTQEKPDKSDTKSEKNKAAKNLITVKNKPNGIERERGPRGWLIPILESSYTKLVPRDLAENHEENLGETTPADTSGSLALAGMAKNNFRSVLQPGRGEGVLAAVDQNLWLERLAEYKRRKAFRFRAMTSLPAVDAMLPPGPVIPGEKNWSPLGPSVVMNGQAEGSPPVGGRIAGIAVAPGGQIIYAASANGGVFRSNNSGVSWRSLMDSFDVDPTNFASTSLACGAIAIDRADPNRIYVGTGEGDTFAIFQNRITNALPAYRGIGPIRSDDGGATWEIEMTDGSSPSLAGKAFFAIAVDPTNRENVIGATTEGLYQRMVLTDGSVIWTRRRAGVFSSVVAVSSGTSKRFFAAEWGVGVYHSTDGTNWSLLATAFPTANVGRISLGVQLANSNLVYALIVNTDGALLGVFRADGIASGWKQISNPPDVLPVDADGGSQGDYDLAIAVDPVDANLIYLGGSYFNGSVYPASIWRCAVQSSGTAGYRMTGVSIGIHAHADVHVLVHSPNDSNALWVGCDGGVFLNRNPQGTGIFSARNNGLACLCPTFFAQHPTDPNILFCGLQDNGTARTSGGPIWEHVNGGDGGYCLLNWSNPNQVLVFANGKVYRSTNGGLTHNSWASYDFPWRMMTEPIVGTPYNPAQPNDAKLVALGAGNVVYLSRDFGNSWTNQTTIPTSTGVYSMVFASADRFFVGTTGGEVFRCDRAGNSWQVTRIDNVVVAPLGLRGIIADIAVDWSDLVLSSVYIALGGTGDYRHVWHFDGTRWTERSGPSGIGASNLLDVEHNAIVVDRQASSNVYVGADIGVWHSSDRGFTWEPMPNGLPDAPVFDLQIHPTQRLLRATTHGRGLYEYPLD